MNDLSPTDRIKLDDVAVAHRTHEWATQEDVDRACEDASLTVRDLFIELDALVDYEARKTGVPEVTVERASELVQEILYARYDLALRRETAHRIPLAALR